MLVVATLSAAAVSSPLKIGYLIWWTFIVCSRFNCLTQYTSFFQRTTVVHSIHYGSKSIQFLPKKIPKVDHWMILESQQWLEGKQLLMGKRDHCANLVDHDIKKKKSYLIGGFFKDLLRISCDKTQSAIERYGFSYCGKTTFCGWSFPKIRSKFNWKSNYEFWEKIGIFNHHHHQKTRKLFVLLHMQ